MSKVTISAILDEYIECRINGHMWRYLDVEKSNNCYIQIMKCRRCSLLKAQYLSSELELVKTMYKYPKNYLVKGLGILTPKQRGLLRKRMLKQKGLI